MTDEERQWVLGDLRSSEARLLERVDGLTEAQWRYKETPERWSIAETIEHVVLFGGFVLGRIEQALAGAAQAEKMDGAGGKERLVRGLAETRHVRLNAREQVRPEGRWADTAEMVQALRNARARTIVFVEEARAPLREHFFAHIAFGDLDCYQWLVVLGRHGARHALQIEEIQGSAGYPAGR